MRFMVMHYQTQAMEDGVQPSPELQAAIGQYMEEASLSGVLLTGEGVAPSSEGARVEVADGDVRVIDGPFAEAKELIAGFAILEVRSKAEAVEHAPIVRSCRNAWLPPPASGGGRPHVQRRKSQRRTPVLPACCRAHTKWPGTDHDAGTSSPMCGPSRRIRLI